MSQFSSAIRKSSQFSQSGRMPTNPQSTSQNFQDYEQQGINEAILQWSSIGDGQSDIILSGQSDIGVLKNLRNVLLALQTEFTEGGSKIVFTGEKKDDLNKRLILLEGQIDGLLRRKINYSSRDERGGTRIMDYTVLLNEKETQIVELEKKINNLEERLRKATARQLELENHIAQIYADLKRREEIILAKNDVILAEVASSNTMRESLNRLKRNIDLNRAKIGDLERVLLEGVTFPEVGSFEIKADLLAKDGAISRSKSYQNLPENKKYKTKLIQLFREFEKLHNQQGGIGDGDIERILEGFLIGFNGTRIKESVATSIERRKMEDDYIRIRDQFGVAAGIFQSQIDKLKRENPTLRIDVDSKIFDILKEQKVSVIRTGGDVVHLERFSQKTVEVPVQDTRTKHLIHLLAVQMKKFTSKYPKLQEEMDSRLIEFFQQEFIDVIEVDEADRVVEIVKFVPQVVKVENVYAYSSEKSRKVQFHLRVLIKALLEQLQKIKARTGAVLEIDEAIVGMINQQIMGVVDVDDILKVFRVVPKIVEVEKIVEKVVDRIVEVPQVVTVEKVIEKIVEIEKIKEVEKIVNVPLEVPTVTPVYVEKIVPCENVIEKIVEVPHYIDKIVEVTKQVLKIEPVERIEEKIVEVEKVVEVEKIVNHVQNEIQIVENVIEKIVPVERVVEVPVQVPVIVEKIVEKVVQVPQIIDVERVVQKIVPQIQYRNAKEIENHIETRTKVEERIVEKPIPIIQTIERIVEVPQIIEKIVPVQNTVREPYEVKVVEERIVVQEKLKEIPQIIERPITVVKEVPTEIEKIIQIPVIHDRIVKVEEIIERPIIQKVENTIVKEVILRDPLVVKEPKIVEVQKIVNHYIDVPKPIKYIEEKLVEVIRNVDRIKQVKVPVEKVIEKMVEVPKVVEVEKVVEKVVVVPRVVEKIVEVPQIVERVVPKVIVEERIKEVERSVQVPVIQERVVEVEVPKNVYVEVEKVVERVVDKLVEVPKYEEKIITNDIISQKIIEIIKEIPKEVQIEKLVHNKVEVPLVVEIEKPQLVSVEVPIVVDRVVEKFVPILETTEKTIPIPQIVEKVVPLKVESVQTVEVVRVEEKVVVDTQIKEVVREVPYIQDQIKEVQTVVEKIVPVQSVVQEVVTAQQIVEKVVQKSTTVQKVHEVEKLVEKSIPVKEIVTVENIVPQLVNVNRYIQNIVEKIVQIPIIVEQVKEVVRDNEKVVEVRSEYETIKQVETVTEKAVLVEKFKEAVRNINYIEKVLQIVDRLEQIPVVVPHQEEKLVEVPYILQKIVEKIVVMPQIVEVLKYVHEVTEKEELGVAVGVDVATHEQRYKMISRDLKGNLDLLLVELRKIKGKSPNVTIQIQIIEKFLAQLEQFIMYPKIVQVPVEKVVEKIVQKDKLVTLPTQDERSVKMELTLSLLVQKLLLEMKRLKKQNPSLNLQLEDDIKLIFFSELDTGSNLVGRDFNLKLKSFSDSVYRKFESLGPWSYDHQMMLNSFLQERFLMANLIKNANLEIEKTKSITSKRDEAMKKFETENGLLKEYITKIRSSMTGLPIEQESLLRTILTDYDSFVEKSIVVSEPVRMLGDLEISDKRIQSLIREKDVEILNLRNKIISVEKEKSKVSTEGQLHALDQLRTENQKLMNQITQLRVEKGSTQLVASYKGEIQILNERILELEQEKSNLTAELSNLRREYEAKLNIYENMKNLGVTQIGGDSILKSPNMRSPVQHYEVQSPEYSGRMVESEYRKTEETDKKDSDIRGVTSRVYGLGDSGHSGSSATRQPPSYQPVPAIKGSALSSSGIYQGSSSSGYRGQAESNLAGSGVGISSQYQPTNAYQPKFQTGTGTGTAGYTGITGGHSAVTGSGYSGTGSNIRGAYQSSYQPMQPGVGGSQSTNYRGGQGTQQSEQRQQAGQQRGSQGYYGGSTTSSSFKRTTGKNE